MYLLPWVEIPGAIVPGQNPFRTVTIHKGEGSKIEKEEEGKGYKGIRVFALPHTDPNALNQGSLGHGLVTVNGLSGSGPQGRR